MSPSLYMYEFFITQRCNYSSTIHKNTKHCLVYGFWVDVCVARSK